MKLLRHFSLSMVVLISSYQTLIGQTGVDTNKLNEVRAKAEAGDAKAQCEVGSAYAFRKFGLNQDWTEAMKWFQKSAQQNNAEAQCRLGTGYDFGVGLKKNSQEGVKWYRKSADQNFTEAYWRLGCCYSWGNGVQMDKKEAVKYFRKAAESNYIPAQKDLIYYYHTGEGVEKDSVEAYKWALLVNEASSGYPDHHPERWTNYMRDLKSNLSPEQLSDAAKRAHEWQSSHQRPPIWK